LIEYIKSEAADLLYFFGYVKTESNPTGFFEFEEHTDENLRMLYGF